MDAGRGIIGMPPVPIEVRRMMIMEAFHGVDGDAHPIRLLANRQVHIDEEEASLQGVQAARVWQL